MNRNPAIFIAITIPLALGLAAGIARADQMDQGSDPLASIDDDIRFVPTTRPALPAPQVPPEATTQNSDTGKPPVQWQRLTDDWCGLRPRLDDRGIAFDASLATYAGQDLSGGLDTRDGGFGYLFNLNMTLDSQRLAGYQGGTFFVNFRQQDGLHHSLDGSFNSATSHLYVPQRTEVSEIWYEQKMSDDKIRMRIGKIDANTEFDAVDNSGEFLNGNFSSSPTILAFPTDPDPAFGADLFFYPNEHLYAGAGAFDGSLQEGEPTGALGPAGRFHSVFLVGEAGVKWSLAGGRDGRVGVGVWYHTGDIASIDVGRGSSGAIGPYVTFDQVLWQVNPDLGTDHRGIALFALGGYADPSISQANYQFGGGAKWTGLIPLRDDDILGAGVNYIAFGSGADRSPETTTEAFYKFRFSPWFSVQPDLQYIAGEHTAVAATIQVLIDF
jgi:porin